MVWVFIVKTCVLNSHLTWRQLHLMASYSVAVVTVFCCATVLPDALTWVLPVWLCVSYTRYFGLRFIPTTDILRFSLRPLFKFGAWDKCAVGNDKSVSPTRCLQCRDQKEIMDKNCRYFYWYLKQVCFETTNIYDETKAVGHWVGRNCSRLGRVHYYVNLQLDISEPKCTLTKFYKLTCCAKSLLYTV